MSAPKSTRRKVDGDAIRREVEERIEHATGTLPADLIAPNPAPLPDPEPKPTPEPERTVAAAADGVPTGPIRTLNPKGRSFGVDWSQVMRWRSRAQAAATEFAVPLHRLEAHEVIESQGIETAIQRNPGNGDSFGLMQVVPRWWQKDIERLAGRSFATFEAAGQAMIADPLLALRAGAFVLSTYYKQHGSWDAASSSFFTGKPGWSGADSVNGTQGGDYKRCLNELIAELDAAGEPEPGPVPVPDVDPLAVIAGGAYPPVTYGWLDDVGLDYYGYGVGHGTQRSTQHTGIDVPLSCGTVLYAPAAGVVDCVGGRGTPRWGQGCGAYADVDGGGVGNITILLDGGVKLTLGHCRQSFVEPGDRVVPGQRVGTVGSMNGCHVHVETSVERNKTYWLVEPVAALRDVMQAPPPPGRAGYVHYTNVPGAPNGLWLPEGLSFRVHLINPAQRNQRPGIKMTPQRFVQHETGNPNPGANADMHLRYLLNGAPDKNGRSQQLGYHLTVDEREAILMIPLDEVAWHGGDGAGPCNYTGIASELCVHDNNQNKVAARANAEALAAAVMESLGLNQIEPHRSCSGKDCPHYMLAENYWPAFVSNVAANRQRIRGDGGSVPPPPRSKYGELSIPVEVFEALFLDPKLPADPDGAFTRWMAANDWYYPVHKLVRDGQESYLITGGGVLHYRDGVVTVLDDDAAAAIAERAGA